LGFCTAEGQPELNTTTILVVTFHLKPQPKTQNPETIRTCLSVSFWAVWIHPDQSCSPTVQFGVKMDQLFHEQSDVQEFCYLLPLAIFGCFDDFKILYHPIFMCIHNDVPFW